MTDGTPDSTPGSAPYLIAHKVRGKAAFDVAVKMQVGEEEWWIVSTSGHRAHPYWSHLLTSNDPLDTESILKGWAYHQDEYSGGRFKNYPPQKMPDDLPDHYAVNDKKIPKVQVAGTSLQELAQTLADLGLE